MHSCDVRCCCNPQHLSLGSRLENLSDMRKKGRSTKGRDSPVRGELHVKHKLTLAQAKQIKATKTYKDAIALGSIFGVSKSLSVKIFYGDSWKWL